MEIQWIFNEYSFNEYSFNEYSFNEYSLNEDSMKIQIQAQSQNLAAFKNL